MAKIQNLIILNPADKTRMYAVATGSGAPADADEPLIVNTKDFPIGSQYSDTAGKKFYVRFAAAAAAADWVLIGPASA